MKRILVVDDHTLFRDALRLLLERAVSDADIREAATLRQALRSLGEAPFDLALVDLMLPDARQMEAVRALRQDYPELPLIVVSANDKRDVVLQAMRLGARGFICKTDGGRLMISTIQVVLSGGASFPARYQTLGASPAPVASSITARQREVLALLVEGLSNKEIAERLGIAEVTAKVHVHNLLQAIGTTSRSKAAALARSQGLLDPAPALEEQ